MSSHDPQLAELSGTASRLAELFNHHVGEITKDAERRAEELRQQAERDAEAARRQALESGRRVFEHIDALEQPLAELVRTLRHEVDRVPELGSGKGVRRELTK